MSHTKIKKMLYTSLLAALTCAGTAIISIPSPTGGYIHPGDGLVFLSGILLGPFFGGFAAGFGSMLADLILGYTIYAPATFIIKGIAGIFCSYVFSLKKNQYPTLTGSIIGSLVIILGYLAFDSFLLDNGLLAALVGLPGNLVQTGFGIILAVSLYPFLKQYRQ